ncbi:hypothetical protein HR12_31080 [Microbacterium sp. SUBG005]|nr:hypothetical protein HR12_31080 [Microbacterium sp. SUBG005]
MAIFSPTSSSRLKFFKQRAFIKTFGKGFHFQRVTEQFLVLLETDERVLTAGSFNPLSSFDFVNLGGHAMLPDGI